MAWIQEAIKKPGALRAWFQRNRGKLRKILKMDPLTKRGRIKFRALSKLLKLHDKGKIRLTGRTRKRIQLAKTLHKLRKR